MTVTPAVRVGNGADLLSVLPYVVGFHPEESLVVMVMNQGRLAMTARFDLAAFDHPDDALTRFQQVRQRFSGGQLILVAYSHELSTAHDCLALVETVTPADEVIDSIVCSGGRWWSRWCRGDCCPPEGKPIARASVAEVQAVTLGLSALPSRDYLESMVTGPSAHDGDELSSLHDLMGARVRRRGKRQRRQRVSALLARAVPSDADPLSREELVELVQLVQEVVCRDVAWLMIRPATAERHQAVWAAAVKVTVDRAALPVVSLLGAAAWIGGNGALLNCCLDRGAALAEQQSVTYSMLDLLATLSEQLVEPRLWSSMTDDPAAMDQLDRWVESHGQHQLRLDDGA